VRIRKAGIETEEWENEDDDTYQGKVRLLRIIGFVSLRSKNRKGEWGRQPLASSKKEKSEEKRAIKKRGSGRDRLGAIKGESNYRRRSRKKECFKKKGEGGMSVKRKKTGDEHRKGRG